jgi:type II secretory pathway component GspD/PulD (secretin)
MDKKISVQTSDNGKLFVANVMGVGLGLAILFGGSVMPVSAAMAVEPKWPSGPYKYVVVDQDLRDTLTEFGRNIGVPVKASEALSGHRIRGKLPEGTAEQYIKKLCSTYGLVWFYDGQVLHFSSETEIRTEQVDLGPVNAGALNNKMKALGTTDAKFSIRAVDAHAVSVYGPPPYIGFVRQTVSALQKLGGKVRVIRAGVETP